VLLCHAACSAGLGTPTPRAHEATPCLWVHVTLKPASVVPVLSLIWRHRLVIPTRLCATIPPVAHTAERIKLIWAAHFMQMWQWTGASRVWSAWGNCLIR
jgi:hypothetical protein